MPTTRTERLEIRSSDDVVKVRQQARTFAVEAGLSLVDQTKIITAASELARNTLDYGGGGIVHMDVVEDGGRRGLRLTFEDSGPGIADVAQAMRDGFTTGSGLGLGLGGAKRLSNEFSIDSKPGVGTKITIARWKGLMISVAVNDPSQVAEARREAAAVAGRNGFDDGRHRPRRARRHRARHQSDQARPRRRNAGRHLSKTTTAKAASKSSRSIAGRASPMSKPASPTAIPAPARRATGSAP